MSNEEKILELCPKYDRTPVEMLYGLPDLVEAVEKVIEHLERDAEYDSNENKRVSAEQNMQHVRALRAALRKGASS